MEKNHFRQHNFFQRNLYLTKLVYKTYKEILRKVTRNLSKMNKELKKIIVA